MSTFAPLWTFCTINDDVLSESTNTAFRFDYVDISNVTSGRISQNLEETTFSEAPSRARRLARPGDVIVSTVRTYLRAIAPVYESPRPRVYSTGFAVIRPDDSKSDSRFVQYCFTSDEIIDKIIAHSTGVSYPAINAADISRLRLPLPDLPTQRRIADYLDRETAQIDAMTEALDRLVARLEERRDALRDGVLRRVPTTVQLQFVTQGIHTGPFGTQLGRGDYVNDGIPVINPTHIVNASILPDAKVSVSASSADRLQAHRMRAGEIVMARRGDLGRCAVVDEKSSGFICGTGSILISPDATKVDSRFAQVSLSSTDTVFQLEDASVGSTMSNLSESTLRHIRIPFPSLDEQRRIADYLDRETAKIDAMIAKAGELRALLDERRSALITATVTGQHPVPEEP